MEYYEEHREVSYNGDTSSMVIYHPGLSRASWPAVQWSVADDLGKWVLLTLTEIALVTAFAAFLSAGAFGWAIFFLVATILPFVPFIQARELCRQQKMFAFPSYSGPGNAWGKYLLRYVRLFHSFHSLTHDKDATDRVKAVYAEREPAVWQTISAISNLYTSVIGKGNVELTSDTKEVLVGQLVEFKARIDDLEKIVSSVKSLKTLKAVEGLDILTSDQEASDRVVADLRMQISGVKELMASND